MRLGITSQDLKDLIPTTTFDFMNKKEVEAATHISNLLGGETRMMTNLVSGNAPQRSGA